MKTQARGDIRREAILAFIRQQWSLGGYAPTIRDIAAHVDASASTVHRHVLLLAKQGLIEYQPGTSRTIRPVQPLREDRS